MTTSSMIARGPILLACISLAACDVAQRPSHSTLIRDSAGIRIVRTPHPPEQDTVVWEVAPAPTLSIGTVGGPEAEQLFRVRGAIRLSDGSVVVLNGGTRELRWFGADGGHQVTAGGGGDGPGEFQSPGELRRLAGDTVVVWDAARSTQSWFGPDGTFVRSRLARRDRWEGLFGPEYLTDVLSQLPDGSLLLRVRALAPDVPLGWSRLPLGLARTGRDDLSRVDTLGWYRGREEFNVGTSSEPLMRSVPWFARNTEAAAGGEPMRIFIGGMENPGLDGYDIDVFRPDGSLERIIRHAIPRRGVRDEELEAARESQRRSYGSAPIELTEEWIAEQVNSMPVPDAVPKHAGLLVDGDGNLWVQEWDVLPSARLRYRIFAPDGTLRGLVEIPDGLRILEVGSDHLLGLRRDDDGVEFVQVHRVQKGG